jgi:hypothetical protein
MTFLAKCTNCGESLQVDPTQKEAVCSACETPFLFERTTFNSEMAEEAKLKSELISKYDERISILQGDINELEKMKTELSARISRRSILGKASKLEFQDELALVEAKIATAHHEIATAEKKKEELYSHA